MVHSVIFMCNFSFESLSTSKKRTRRVRAPPSLHLFLLGRKRKKRTLRSVQRRLKIITEKAWKKRIRGRHRLRKSGYEKYVFEHLNRYESGNMPFTTLENETKRKHFKLFLN